MEIQKTTGLFNIIPCIPSFVRRILATLGEDVYLVGGTSRDLLRGKVPVDWDMATGLTPAELMNRFAGDPSVHVSDKQGKSFGVCRITNEANPDIHIDIARFRTDGSYGDQRHPDEVKFVGSIEMDLQRRDFTINAIAITSDLNTAFYPAGALDDLEYGFLTTVGDPQARFEEDPLRILRLFRQFAQGHGSYIWGDMLRAVRECNALLLPLTLSNERVRDELNKLLLSNDRKALRMALRLMHQMGVLKLILPEVDALATVEQNCKYHAYNAFEHTIRVVSFTPPVLALRVAALLHDTGKPHKATVGENGTTHYYQHELASADITREVMVRLKYPNDTIDFVTSLVRWHMYQFWAEPTQKKFRKLMAKMQSVVGPVYLMRLRRADRLGMGTIPFATVHANYLKVLQVLRQTMKAKPVTTTRGLAVSGSDVMKVADIPSGKQVGVILRNLMDMVIENPELNDREGLLARLSKFRISGRLV